MRGRKAFRYRIYPTREQEARLLRWEASQRWLWNSPWSSAEWDSLVRETNVSFRLRSTRSTNSRICARRFRGSQMFRATSVPSCWSNSTRRGSAALNASRAHLAGSEKAGTCSASPNPHPKVWRLDGTTLRFPKLGNLRAVIHRPLEGKPKSVTLRREGDQWFASILCEVDRLDPVPRTDPIVAIDRGITQLLADSDGTLVPNPRHLERTLKRLAHAQRVVSRRKKGSKNREKAKARVMRLHRKVRRQREHVLHELSAAYAKSHGTVVVESSMLQG